MNDIYVFLGPTLAEKDARAELDAVYLPPAAAGDVYRLWERRPRAIGIVDGYFDHVPAVWHKEILWMMEHGVHVFGAAGSTRPSGKEPWTGTTRWRSGTQPPRTGTGRCPRRW
jgi:hypothetical protein